MSAWLKSWCVWPRQDATLSLIHIWLFGETVGSFVVSGASAALAGLDCTIIGTVGGARLRISAGSSRIDLALERLREAHAALAALLD